jgi:hypothetical protein
MPRGLKINAAPREANCPRKANRPRALWRAAGFVPQSIFRTIQDFNTRSGGRQSGRIALARLRKNARNRPGGLLPIEVAAISGAAPVVNTL